MPGGGCAVAGNRCRRRAGHGRDPRRPDLPRRPCRPHGRAGDAGRRPLRPPQPRAAGAGVHRAGPRWAAGPAFVVVANHFKSKGCGKPPAPMPTRMTARPAGTRPAVESAQRLDAWLATDPTGNGGASCIDRRRSERLRDRKTRCDGCARPAGTTRFPTSAEALQLRLRRPARPPRPRPAQPRAGPALRGAAEWHVNADEPRAAGYRNPDSAGTPWRSSDHDPLVLGLDLRP